MQPIKMVIWGWFMALGLPHHSEWWIFMDLWDSKPMVNLDSCQKQPVLIDILVNSDADMGSMMKSQSSSEKKIITGEMSTTPMVEMREQPLFASPFELLSWPHVVPTAGWPSLVNPQVLVLKQLKIQCFFCASPGCPELHNCHLSCSVISRLISA